MHGAFYRLDVRSDEYEIILCKNAEQNKKQLAEDSRFEANNYFLFSAHAMRLTDDENMRADAESPAVVHLHKGFQRALRFLFAVFRSPRVPGRSRKEDIFRNRRAEKARFEKKKK